MKENHNKIDGDIVESGVYKGSSLLAMGLLLKEIGSSKKVYGFDSFSGFPPVFHDYDDTYNVMAMTIAVRTTTPEQAQTRPNL